MFKFLLVLAFAPAIFAFMQPCPELPDRMPLRAVSNKCDANGCTLTSTENIEFEVDFVAPNGITYFNPSGRLVFRGPDQQELYEPINFPPHIADGCSNLVGSSCPIAAGETRTWEIDWDWHREYMTENIDYGVEARLYDQNEYAFACGRFLVRYSP